MTGSCHTWDATVLLGILIHDIVLVLGLRKFKLFQCLYNPSAMKRLEQQLSTTSIHETQSSNSVRNHSDPPSRDDLLIISIFSRLPLKSIARFRCVSKFLASILRRHDFTELFLTKSLTSPRLLFTVNATNGKLLFYSTPQPHIPEHNSCLVPTPYHTSFPEYLPSDKCSTVCGLELLQGWKRKVRVICNPATGEFLTLPKVKVKSNPTEIAQTKTYLGYDPIGKQFKVLCVTSSRDERSKTHQGLHKTQSRYLNNLTVLTLESGKRVWRTVEHKFYFEDNIKMSGDICIDGVLYFRAAVGRSSMIVCFDVGSEKFSFINTNEDMRIQYPCLAGSLTLFNYKEDAGNHKWCKHSYVLSPLGSDLVQYNRFIGMTSTGEVVLSILGEPSDLFYLSFYNLQSGTFKRVYFQGLEEFKQQFTTPDTFLDYVENIKFM
ncbi:hypothetical protein Bca4012_007510 [Brassica carinata]